MNIITEFGKLIADLDSANVKHPTVERVRKIIRYAGPMTDDETDKAVAYIERKLAPKRVPLSDYVREGILYSERLHGFRK